MFYLNVDIVIVTVKKKKLYMFCIITLVRCLIKVKMIVVIASLLIFL